MEEMICAVLYSASTTTQRLAFTDNAMHFRAQCRFRFGWSWNLISKNLDEVLRA